MKPTYTVYKYTLVSIHVCKREHHIFFNPYVAVLSFATCMLLLYTIMYKLKLNYATRPRIDRFIRDTRYEDVLTQTACTKLLLNHNIHTTQEDHCTIVFESDRDRTLAQLKLANSQLFTSKCVD